jgi:gas vesicle protein
MRTAALLPLFVALTACQTDWDDVKDDGADVGEAFTDPNKSVREELGEAVDTTREALDDRNQQGFADAADRAMEELGEELGRLEDELDDAGEDLNQRAERLKRDVRELREESADKWEARGAKIQAELEALERDIERALR